jgi:UDP-glucose 4-epimerase
VILVTGGAGYIGSHACAALAAAGYDFLILDDFSNSQPSVIRRLSQVVGRPVQCIEGSVEDIDLVDRLLRQHSVTAVMHFAAYKAVGESVEQPLRYYQNNVGGAMALLQAMQRAGVWRLVFSSSATVYGDPAVVPINEACPLNPASPYGWSKRMAEQLLADVVVSRSETWRIACLRYFNPVGAHESGLIGEDPLGVPNNLMPYIAQVAEGRRPFLNVWGNDYPTPDGTGVRDYIHVMDLAEGHVSALRYLDERPGLLTVNLGTGQGISVLQMVAAFEKASAMRIPLRVGPRRAGDVAQYWADPSLANRLLGWTATRGLDQMCADAWRWQSSVK